ncbi:MAG TPA: hypothetical protein VME21_00775 [Steroidobacteraceae bacterium]|nr:hypothetical protein [Steroidobacteraceae bacterium]
MKSLKVLALAAAAGCLAAVSATSEAQVAINIGPPPVCPYGYYDYPPYACAPYGYYGPEWFVNGVFVGAGPWFHGPARFHGYVDNRFDLHHGYHGPLPHPGEHPAFRVNRMEHFRGNEMRDGRGHIEERR